MTVEEDPATHGAAVLQMALRAILLSGQATGRQWPGNALDAGNLTPAPMSKT